MTLIEKLAAASAKAKQEVATPIGQKGTFQPPTKVEDAERDLNKPHEEDQPSKEKREQAKKVLKNHTNYWLSDPSSKNREKTPLDNRQIS